MRFLGVLLLPIFIFFSNHSLENHHFYCQKYKTPKILVAEKTSWFGGVSNVRGEKYFLKIKNYNSINLHFGKLLVEGKNIPIRIVKKVNLYEIYGVLTETDESKEYADAGNSEVSTTKNNSVNISKSSWVEYTFGKSKNTQKLVITKFVEKENKEQNQ